MFKHLKKKTTSSKYKKGLPFSIRFGISLVIEKPFWRRKILPPKHLYIIPNLLPHKRDKV